MTAVCHVDTDFQMTAGNLLPQEHRSWLPVVWYSNGQQYSIEG